jgi:hypothetical protein
MARSTGCPSSGKSRRLETPGPFRPYFQNTVRHGHHYAVVAINGETLQFKAFNIDDEMSDTFELKK